MIKNHSIVQVTDFSRFVTDASSQLVEIFEPTALCLDPGEITTVMVMAKSHDAVSGQMAYLVVSPDNKQWIALEDGIELSPPASRTEFLNWFYEAHKGKHPDAALSFTYGTGKNAPKMESENKAPTGDIPTPSDVSDTPGVDREVAQAIESEQENL